MIVVLSPHNDDETLFAAFTVLRYAAHVVVCHGSAGDYGSSVERMHESAQAVAMLGGTFEQWDVPPRDPNYLHARVATLRDARPQITRVFAPNRATSHPDHRLLAEVAADVFRGRLTTYHTYDVNESDGSLYRVTGRTVEIKHPSWVHRKLQALACYATQASHPRANEFFLEHQHEYYGADA